MANLFDYLAWRGDLDFIHVPLNPVDFIIFSQIAYLPFDGIVPGPDEKKEISLYHALKTLKEKIQKEKSDTKQFFNFKEDPDFINALVSSNRFRNCGLFGFVNQIDTEKEVQFSAVCITTGEDSCSIIFRGTDTSFIGWKEDFNMAFREIIPSQLEAVRYLEKMAHHVKGSLRLAGHSKGGNLAVYASSFCGKNIQKRITDIYSNDAPGFNIKIVASEGFSLIKNKIHTFIPQSSVVGMMLERGSDYTVIKSSQTGLMQHSLYSWEITYNNLVYAEKITRSSRFVRETIREWLESLDNKQREHFIEAIYNILSSSEAKSIHELEKSWLTSAGRIIKSMGNVNEQTRKIILNTLAELFRSAGRSIDTLFIKKNNE